MSQVGHVLLSKHDSLDDGRSNFDELGWVIPENQSAILNGPQCHIEGVRCKSSFGESSKESSEQELGILKEQNFKAAVMCAGWYFGADEEKW